jgi:hypothetical protein
VVGERGNCTDVPGVRRYGELESVYRLFEDVAMLDTVGATFRNRNGSYSLSFDGTRWAADASPGHRTSPKTAI